MLIPKDKNLFIFISEPDFTDNPKAFFRYINTKKDIRCIWLFRDKSNIPKAPESIDEVYYYLSIKGLWQLLTAKTIVTSHSTSDKVLCKRQLHVDLWHGVPLKTILAFQNDWYENDRRKKMVATSILTKSLFSGAFLTHPKDIWITGQPRTDFRNDKWLSKIYPIQEYEKVILYMPTFRQREGFKDRDYGNVIDDNFFRLNDFDLLEFERFLADNNYLFLLKLHPYEENLYSNKIQTSNNIKLINNETLFEKGMDVNDILNDVDELITDYSSVYFDFLLHNKKIIFLPSDLKVYKEKRGFLMEPYELWAPGDHVYSQEELQTAMVKKFKISENYKFVKSSIHRYSDEKSSERVYSKILEELGA